MPLFATIFGYLLAILTLPLILFFVLLGRVTSSERRLDPLLKNLARCIPLFFGIRLHVKYRDLCPTDRACIYMANHVNLFDPFILFAGIPVFVRGVELEDHFRYPLWGTIIRSLGNIPISHRNTKKALQSINRAVKAVSQGVSIIILPEGHRTRTGELQDFKMGPFRLAGQTGAPIIPLAMRRGWERKSVLSLKVNPGSMEMVFGTPIYFEEYRYLSERQLRDLVRERIARLIDNPADTRQHCGHEASF